MPTNYWRATLNWKNTAVNQFAQNVLHFAEPSGVLQPDQVGSVIDNLWWGDTANSSLRNYTSGNVVLQSITLQLLEPGPTQGGIPFVTRQAAGSATGLVKHPALGFVFAIKDGLAGKSHRGRFYHYGANGTHLLDGGPASAILTPTALFSLTGLWMERFGPAGNTQLRWQLFHRKLVGTARFTQVTSVEVRPICGVQRRRRIGIGL